MTTITAKQLRDNLATYLDRARHGEEIRITYRQLPPVRLVPYAVEPAPRAKLAGLEALLAAPFQGTAPAAQLSYKELYKQSIGQKYD